MTDTYHPAPPPLATPTSLVPVQAHLVVAALNPLIADALVLYLKTKNFHWHVSGPHFRDYHLLFDEQAAQLLGGVDVLAERVRKIGGMAPHSFRQVLNLRTLPENDEEYLGAEEMVRLLKHDNYQMAMAQRAAIRLCEEEGDTATANILQGMLDETERRIWFLFETVQSG